MFTSHCCPGFEFQTWHHVGERFYIKKMAASISGYCTRESVSTKSDNYGFGKLLVLIIVVCQQNNNMNI